MKNALPFFSILLLGSVGCCPPVETISLEGKVFPPLFPEVSTDGWNIAAADLPERKSTPTLGTVKGGAFQVAMEKKGIQPGKYLLYVLHPKKGGRILEKVLEVGENPKNLKALSLGASSTLVAMAFQFAAGLGDRDFLGIDPVRLEGLVSKKLLYRYENAFDVYLSGEAKDGGPAANPALALDSYTSLKESFSRVPD
ncbi:MAG TPA: hypothetical protein V6C82_04370 [Chroococcales cyanobacterium]